MRGLLVERTEEVTALRSAIDAARAGTGSVTLIDGPAGAGKSRLLSIAGNVARNAGFQVVGACGTELERDFAFGVAIQLFEPLWMAAGPERRNALLAGPAARVAELLESGAVPAEAGLPARAYPLIHALFALTRNLMGPAVEAQPLAVLVDDANWVDGPSLRFLAYLAQRCASLPLAMILALRTDDEMMHTAAASALRAAAGRSVLHPSPLTAEGVAAIVGTRLPDASAAFVEACARLTSGNPFLLTKLLDQVLRDGYEADDATARRLDELTPESVLNAVVAQLGSLPEDTVAVARGLAVLGDGSSIEQVAELSGLSADRAAVAADLLGARQIVHPGSRLSFVHPLVASAVRNAITPLDRGRAHRRAAALLLDSGAPAELVAAQLLNAPSGGDARAVETLRLAARRSMAAEAPETAMRMLARALAEPPASDLVPEILAELAEAEAAAGQAGALARLEHALGLDQDEERRARLTLSLARVLLRYRRFEEASHVVTQALDAAHVGSLADEFDATLVHTARFVPELRERAQTHGRDLLARVGSSPSSAQRSALAEVAFNAALSGEERASVMAMVECSWGGGILLETPSAPAWRLLCGALVGVGELEHALELCEAASNGPSPEAAPPQIVGACKVWPLLGQGRILDALQTAEASLTAPPEDWGRLFHLHGVCAALGFCLTEHGEFGRAETALSILEHPDVEDSPLHALLLDARARLRLAQLRPAEALHDARAAGQVAGGYAFTSPAVLTWRTSAALAHLALGDRAKARELANEELELAEQIGIRHVSIRALRCLGLAERGRVRHDLLQAAVELGDALPPRLEHIEALIALGASLRRANHRAASRVPLERALELCRAGGASRLATAARTELAATGTRARRMLLSGVDSLTPSELRVARLAASGHTTRQMAETLFVTRKTIEYHLHQIYRKLGVNTREELQGALEQPIDA